MKRLILLAGATVVLAACGSTDPTVTAAKCLRNALANQLAHVGPTCKPTGYAALGLKYKVACTRQSGNQYSCDVTGPATRARQVQGGVYTVTVDGSSVTYQFQPPRKD